ncbi:hypothetical protein A3H80_03035 [Candidatus Roizmanbacteria bacterium RIFCSPLOWO2_02_FULL_37_19]|uniref:Aminoglycoside phosphotransferase domain-containing protein n=1 Tax=Candidatus Roizmanbacteria bacterium RIFCSPHIGHO2_02_FULL_37_24 TaxID=1802037 RepID=A0A1F7GYB3_9BACT|nr:MAG: hypothetical protein A2862_00240 [Candidatus Roizmanbacteria bacterium RIFCSPHIGHO2_01_FULL_38_41]OGK24019.1 MAG: hypothetical protein A3C24_02935 [Candidatus Roizmanbacteria bacterium RIFCSPHIGHO2_02_FULL_37_24]OGK32367.1 MAG: hypothetical protein A3E10_04255 [Candidatus Roizmanbacteria bacterium RIFCSPHIGHO2_12_FULL_37_23]OGK44685.1 MAG: hypothetical protein A2956_00965 [Candidatus Roizmanbacteria bacterium RIFCSPLOWO2_01_FULL_37_57]OGK53743.1 MAG: hypothetical protein A3H80_03035 [Ca
MKQEELDQINQKIADRSNVFYWQTDRDITPQQAGQIWADRHRYFTDDELEERINHVLGDKVINIDPLDPNAQTNLGNVNSVRVAHLSSGKDIVIRSHPKGIKNGYFHAEAQASSHAKKIGVPSFETLAVHDFEGENDFAFHITEKLPGTAISKWLEENLEDEPQLLKAIGRMMARVHEVKVKGFGPFDNEKARSGALVGVHSTYADAIKAGLAFNLKVLEEEGIFTEEQVKTIDNLFNKDSSLLSCDSPVLVHNDFAD